MLPAAERCDNVTDDDCDGEVNEGCRTCSDDVVVYAHSASELYRIDPNTLGVTRVAAFIWPVDGHSHQMTDIAVTGGGEIWGVTGTALYRVDAATARCTLVASVSQSFNALTFLPPVLPGEAERLVGATVDGNFYDVNTSNGTVRFVGAYGGGAGSSGDLVSVAGAGTFATVNIGASEYLTRVNTSTGVVTWIGRTGVSATYGLGYWGGQVYGFTSAGQFVTINITSGAATVVTTSPHSWWGAGVSTCADVGEP